MDSTARGDASGDERGGSTVDLDRRGVLAGVAAAGLAPLATSRDTAARPETDSGRPGNDELTAGVASRDITPETGGPFFGYVRPDITADGVAIRLFTQVLVLDDGRQKVALISGDLGVPDPREAVLEYARPLGFDRDTVLFATTHTHAGPDDMGEWIASQIGAALAEADANRQPARAGWATADVPDASVNRSIEAHLANYGLDVRPGEGYPELHPEDPELARDTTLRMLRVESTDGDPIAAWAQYANHPTAFTPANTLFSADLSGAATRRFEARFEEDPPVAMHTNGTLGDLIPVYDEYAMYAEADDTGAQVARAMWDAWQAAGADLSRDVPLHGKSTIVEYDGQTVGDGEQVSSVGVFGLPLLRGGKNGPTPFYGLGLNGQRRPPDLADPVHGRKLILAPAVWSPDVEVQAMRIGDRLLLTVPGEPSTEMGRRMASAADRVAPSGVDDVGVIGIANGYNGYFTTPEEYDQQHYEGGHTVFGKYTSLFVQETHVALTRALAEESPSRVDPAGSPPDPPAAPVGETDADGTLLTEPEGTVERMETLTIAWEGTRQGRDRPVGEPFVRLERRTGSDDWTVETTDLDLGFVWQVDESGEYTARFDVPPAFTLGTYRVVVSAAGYELVTGTFEVVSSTGLQVRGAERVDGGRGRPEVAFVAQHPAPDPEENLRSRAVRPTGGSLVFEYDGRVREATWDADREAWVAVLPGVATGDELQVPAAGLSDGNGNTSGEAVTVTVGEVSDVEWPGGMGPGGGNAPGPLGIGEFPTNDNDVLDVDLADVAERNGLTEAELHAILTDEDGDVGEELAALLGLDEFGSGDLPASGVPNAGGELDDAL